MNGAQPFVYLSASSTPKDREKDKRKAKTIIADPLDAELEVCPQCGKFEDVVLLNLSQDEEVMREAMERKRLLELVKKPKSLKKRKNDLPTDDAVVSGPAMEKAKRKSETSGAVKTLYGNGTKGKDTFMAMSTVTRVCLPSPFEYDEAILIQCNARRSTYSSPPNIISEQAISRSSRQNHCPSAQTGLDVDVQGYTIFILPRLKLRRALLVSSFPLQLSSPTHPQTAAIYSDRFASKTVDLVNDLYPAMKLKSLQ